MRMPDSNKLAALVSAKVQRHCLFSVSALQPQRKFSYSFMQGAMLLPTLEVRDLLFRLKSVALEPLLQSLLLTLSSFPHHRLAAM